MISVLTRPTVVSSADAAGVEIMGRTEGDMADREEQEAGLTHTHSHKRREKVVVPLLYRIYSLPKKTQTITSL